MKKKPTWLKNKQHLGKKTTESANKYFKPIKGLGDSAIDGIREKTRSADEKYGISGKVKSGLGITQKLTSELNEQYKPGEKIAQAKAQLDKFVGDNDTIQSGYTKWQAYSGKATSELFDPARRKLDESGITALALRMSQAMQTGYGKARQQFRPAYAPESAEELLQTTRQALLEINACILQINASEAEVIANRLGKALAAKMSGVAAAGSLFGLVSTFGTAGTGTAIASLSGAAASSATLAWIGGLFGGGMATGAIFTGGLTLVVGAGIYSLLGSKPRAYESLSDAERTIVDATGLLVAAIDEQLEKESNMNVEQAAALLHFSLVPLNELLIEHADAIAVNLDQTHRIKLRHHAIVDFEERVIRGFDYFIREETSLGQKHTPAYAITGVLYALLTQTAVADTPETQLALEAIRRVKGSWAEATEAQISADLADYSPEALKGIANNAKGIYHEMLFVAEYNASHEDTFAEMHATTNHAGSDVVIRSTETGEVVAEYQLKASSSDHIIQAHFEKYPDIDLLATEEVAMTSPAIESSGIHNEAITQTMNDTIADMTDNTLLERSIESAAIGGLAAVGFEVLQLPQGRKGSKSAGKQALHGAMVTGSSTALMAYLFS
jgi:hypothetical protein